MSVRMGAFNTFPPGPRWFVYLDVLPGSVRIHLATGTDASDPLALGVPLREEATIAIYTFGREVTLARLEPVDAFPDDIASFAVRYKLPTRTVQE